MPSTSTQYGTFNPQALDPYPIETSLADKAITSPAMASAMLDTYQLQRQAAGNLYGQEMDTQHQFAKQQLQNQLYEAQLKAAPEFAKTPGGAGLLASAPMFRGALGGASPEDVARFVAQSDQSNQATNLEHAGSGVLSMSSAGTPVSPQAITNLTGLPVNPGVRPDIQIGAGHDAARLGAAAIGAANKGAKTPTESTVVKNEFGQDETVSRPQHWTDQQWHDFLVSKGQVPVEQSALPKQVQPPASTASGGGASATNLPPAAKQSNVAAGTAQQSKAFVDWLDSPQAAGMPAAIKANIKAGIQKNNGQVPRNAQGQIVGGDGTVYAATNP